MTKTHPNATLIIALLILPLLTGCIKSVPAGYQGVRVELYGSDSGIDAEEVDVGRYWVGINEELHLFPTFQQNYAWTRNKDEGSKTNESITFQTQEGLSVNADIGITYEVIPGQVSELFTRYRKGIEEITDVFLRNMVRDAFVRFASNMEVENVYGSGKQALLDSVTVFVANEVEDVIVVHRIYAVGDFRLPEQVIAALDKKISAKQRAEQRENEVAESIAQARKDSAEAAGDATAIRLRADAEAYANRVVAQSITPTLVRYKLAEKWNGVQPTFMSGEGAGVLLNMDQ